MAELWQHARDAIARVRAALVHQWAAERGNFLPWVPVGVGCGIGFYFVWPIEPAIEFLALTPCLVLMFGLSRFFAAPSMAKILLSLLLMALGFNAAQLETRWAATPLLEKPRYAPQIDGRIIAIEPATRGIQLTLDQVSIPVWPTPTLPAKLVVHWRHGADTLSAESLQIGNHVRFAGMLLPMTEPVAPDAHDFRRQAYFDQIGARVTSRGEVQVTELATQDEGVLFFSRLRQRIAARVTATLSGDTAAIASALLNGAQGGISPETLQAMRASGLFHILSISGLHLAVVAAVMFVGLRRLLALLPALALRWDLKKLAALAAILLLPFYSLLVGAPVPAVRSALMTALIMLAVLVERRALSLRTVALAAIVILLVKPHTLLNVSFQLSFAAVTAMVAGYEALRVWRLRRFNRSGTDKNFVNHLGRRFGTLLGGIVFSSLLAGLATAPLTLMHFQQANGYGLFANMVGIPLTSLVIMPAGFLAYLLMPLGLERPALHVMGAGIEGLQALAYWVGGWSGSTLALPSWPLSGFLLILGGGLWLCLWQRRWRLLGIAPILLGGLWCALSPRPDMLVSAEMSHWAIRDAQGQWRVHKLNERDFTLKQWQQRNGAEDFLAINAVGESGDQSRWHCDELACGMETKHGRIALVWDAAALPEECSNAAAIVTPLWHVACSERAVVDGRRLKWQGATSLRLSETGEVEIRSARSRWGARPWSPGWGRNQEKAMMAERTQEEEKFQP
jgi:competence protein ComEC